MSKESQASSWGSSGLSETAWLALQKPYSDKIIVRNLQVTTTAGPDAWGRRKSQPILLTIVLFLEQPFQSAASSDALDSSTVHYGQLSKGIRSHVAERAFPSSGELASSIFTHILEIAGEKVLQAVQVDVNYPKASLLGASAGYKLCRSLKFRSQTVYLQDLRLPCLIGVNANERLQKQAVVINLWIENIVAEQSDIYFELETVVAELVTASSYQTLEALATSVVDGLRDHVVVEPADPYSAIKLRIEKPLAVPFADAPAIEIVRPVKRQS